MTGSTPTPTHRELTFFEKDLLLAFFKHHMSQEQRGELMATLPAAYNALVGAEIVEVKRVQEDRRFLTKADSR